MQIYKATAIVTLKRGFLLLNSKQAARRSHFLVAASDINIDDFDEEITAQIGEGLEAFELTGKTQFKIGEVFGYDGELNKNVAQGLKLVVEIEEEIDEEPEEEIDEESEEEIDEELVNAILSLEADNAAHFNQNNGKPELDVLKGLLGRNVTGKERDDAWLYIQSTEPDDDDVEDEVLDEDQDEVSGE